MNMMTDEEKIRILKMSFEDVIWMAIRYAHGRHTYAPGLVREAVNKFKFVFPEWEIREDTTITPPKEEDLGGVSLRDDYLDNLFIHK